jgi:hypothetical protein
MKKQSQVNEDLRLLYHDFNIDPTNKKRRKAYSVILRIYGSTLPAER